ncbi:hypothetical protein [Streptomyces sp. TP-A0874]|uniref:hypothetical protein n=1 Tax=Streptomyces sp. TP-A0874 TaxID=549819 RepID=UPI000853BB69|nr:hypothetical protein [Streptomyces sp. TP-A0874]
MPTSERTGAEGDLPPFVDEHRVLVSAPVATVWRALVLRASRSHRGSAKTYGRVVGAEPLKASGSPFEPGATLPGFRVVEVDPERLVRLAGRHRFSRYALVLTLADRPGGAVLGARTHAEFPGLLGSLYRRVVVASGAHRLLVRRGLRSLGRQAESLD